MDLLDIVPEYPGAVGSMMKDAGPDAEKESSAPVYGSISRDSGMAMVGKAMGSIVTATDSEIRRNNRLHQLVQMHGEWKQKRAGGAQTQTAVETMGKNGTCEVCGATRTSLRMNHQKNMCGGCQSVYADVFNRLELLASVIHQSGKLDEFLKFAADHVGEQGVVRALQPYLPERVTVDLADGPLDEIAALLAYEGKDSEGLVEHVRQLAAWKEQCSEERVDHGRFLIELRQILGKAEGPVSDLLYAVRDLVDQKSSERDELISAQSALADICRHVGIDEGGKDISYKRIVVAVAQTAAELEAMERYGAVLNNELLTRAHIMDQVVKLLDHPGPADALPFKIECLLGDLADMRNTVREQIEAWEVVATAADARSYANDDVIAAVLQSEAIIEDLMRLAGDLASNPSSLPLLLQLQGDELHNMRINLQAKQGQIGLLADQLSESEQRLLADEQVFARIREVVGADGCANGDLPTAVSSLIYASETLPANRQGAAERLDARLLGLLLDHPEIGLERIAEIREAV